MVTHTAGVRASGAERLSLNWRQQANDDLLTSGIREHLEFGGAGVKFAATGVSAA